MVTIDKIGGQNVNKACDLIGLSTDTKPINDDIPNGSTFLEIDTSNVFFYDAENQVWYQA